MNVAEQKQANANNRNITMVASFGKSMPAGFDPEGVLQAGDIIVMPATMPTEIGQQKFGTNVGEFILVEVQRAGKSIGFNFFPLSLLKNFWPAQKNADGTVETVTASGPINPKGTAVDAFKACQGKIGPNGENDTTLGVQALLGKKIAVSLQQVVTVQKWASGSPIDETKNSNCWDYNFA